MTGSDPVLVVEQIRPVKIMINVSEGLFSKVKLGMKVYVTLDSYGDEQFEGKVTRIAPTIDNATRTFQVEISIENRDERVRPGMFARVTMPYGVENNVVIPDRAVNKLMGRVTVTSTYTTPPTARYDTARSNSAAVWIPSMRYCRVLRTRSRLWFSARLCLRMEPKWNLTNRSDEYLQECGQ